VIPLGKIGLGGNHAGDRIREVEGSIMSELGQKREKRENGWGTKLH
jgi:hypothetical protein